MGMSIHFLVILWSTRSAIPGLKSYMYELLFQNFQTYLVFPHVLSSYLYSHMGNRMKTV